MLSHNEVILSFFYPDMGKLKSLYRFGTLSEIERNIVMDPEGIFHLPKIVVVGAGGTGGNVVNRLHLSQWKNIECVAMNTDSQALEFVQCRTKILLGPHSLYGRGSGGDPAAGAKAAEESAEDIAEALHGADFVFIVYGLGGGAGTGAGPVIARIARRMNALTAGAVTMPFQFEGKRRMAIAQTGLHALQEQADAYFIIQNEKLLQNSAEDSTLLQAFSQADEIMRSAFSSVARLSLQNGMINLDFADIRAALVNAGPVVLSTGSAEGSGRAIRAAQAAINNPMVNYDITGAQKIIFNITASESLTLGETRKIAEYISQKVHPNAFTLFGAMPDPELGDRLDVTILAADFQQAPPVLKQPQLPPEPATEEICRRNTLDLSNEVIQNARSLVEAAANAELLPALPVARSVAGVSSRFVESETLPQRRIGQPLQRLPAADSRNGSSAHKKTALKEANLMPAYLRRIWG